MIRAKGQLPASPRGHRVMCEPSPPKTETEGGLSIPSVAQNQPHMGKIIAAGLNALDAMYDHGDQIGDIIWWGKFAGVVEEWDRIIEEGKGWKTCEHRWDRQASQGREHHVWKCGHCMSTRMASPLCVLNHDDILCNETLQTRIEAGQIAQRRGKTAGNATQHYMDRKDG